MEGREMRKGLRTFTFRNLHVSHFVSLVMAKRAINGERIYAGQERAESSKVFDEKKQQNIAKPPPEILP